MEYSALNDAELVTLARGGVVQAAEVLHAKYASYLYRWIRQAHRLEVLTKIKSAEFDELALGCLYRGIENFRDEKGFFYSYLAKIVRHEATAMAKKMDQAKQTNFALSLDRPISAGSDDSFLILRETSEDPDPFLYQQAETVIGFVDESEDLTSQDRKVLMLWLAGYSYFQIAERCELERKNVDNRCQRIKKILRQHRDYFNTGFVD